MNDLRYGIRSLLKRPGLTAIALVTLALGIGANSAIFSVVNAIILRPLPYPNSEQLVALWGNLGQQTLAQTEISAPEFKDFREQTRTFEQIAAYASLDFNLTGNGEPERLRGAVISANLFSTLRVEAQRGRHFLEEEDQYERDRVAILSDGLWHRRFGGDPGILNKTINLDGRVVTVVGIMPPEFHFPNRNTEIWMPLGLPPDLFSENNRGSHFLNVIARLKANTTRQQAQADLDALSARMSQEHRSTYAAGYSAWARSLHEDIVGDLRRAMMILLGAVGLVLAVACANLAHLRLANGAARHREIAIRAALGAGRGRILRQFLTESLMLSIAGGLIGLFTAFWGVKILIALIPKNTPRIEEIALDSRVVLFTLAISILTGVLSGLVAALQASKTSLNDVLKDSGRGGTESSRRLRLRSVLVVSEFALALVLLIGSGLMLKSFLRVQNVRPGFEPARLLTLRIALPETKYESFQKSRTFFEQLFVRLKSRPEVQSVGAINLLPFGGASSDRSFSIEGRPTPDGQSRPDEQVRFVTAGYFSAMGIPLLKGRDFNDRDQPDTQQVMVVNQALARKFWPNEEAIGKRISFSKRNPKWYEIVGVVGNVKHRGLDSEDRPEIYISAMQPLFADGNIPGMYLAIRTTSRPDAAVATVRSELATIDPDLPIANVMTMEDRISESVSPRRFNLFLFALFAVLALLLAAIGIYGIMSFSVSQRTQEIGIRMALGANRADVLRLILQNGFTLALIGIAVGLGVAFAATRLMSTLLFDVSATDPATFLIDAAVLAIIGLVACYIPAQRATKVDPMVALRNE